MSYAVRADMETRYRANDLVELTDVNEPYVGAINDGVLTQALSDATQLMDGYLRVRYGLPLAQVPDLLVRLCCTIAYRNLHRNGASEEIEAAYKDALKTLGLIRDRNMDIGIGEDEPAAAGGGEVRFTGPARVFSAETLEDY